MAEMKELKPARPLVFNQRLIGASRNHLAYTLAARDYGHSETSGPVEFTGATPQERAVFAGYPIESGRVAECTGAYVHGGILGNHWALIVDDGPGGDHGMHANRGHRMTLVFGGYREFGAGTTAHPNGSWGHSSLCASGDDQRLIGGVAYIDHDGDDFYDLDEGVGGLSIEVVKGAAVRTWDCGSYRLEAGGDGELQLRATLLDLVVTATAPATRDNFKFDVELSEPVLEHWRRLRGTMERGNKLQRRRALLDLAVWTGAMPELAAAFELPTEVSSEREAWEQRCAEILINLTGERLEGLHLNALAKEHRGTLMEAWYTQARSLAGLIEGRLAVEASRGSASTRRRTRAKLLASALELKSQVQAPGLRSLFESELAIIHSIVIE